jgi:DNA-binding CsgD family transcriptional regulator
VLGEECSGLDANIVEVALDIVASRPRDRRRSSGRWPNGLTDREVEVLRVVALGKSNAEAGVILGISARTVQNHLASAYAKLGVESRGGAALFMMEHGLLG